MSSKVALLVDSARLFALVAMASHDAYIAVFDAKYHYNLYNLWRPITAIRNADLTGNKATPREATWLPLGDTPMHTRARIALPLPRQARCFRACSATTFRKSR